MSIIQLFKTGLFVEQMTRLATGTAKLAAKFACHTLRVVDEKVPRKLSSRVSLWTNEDVICWLHQVIQLGENYNCTTINWIYITINYA